MLVKMEIFMNARLVDYFDDLGTAHVEPAPQPKD